MGCAGDMTNTSCPLLTCLGVCLELCVFLAVSQWELLVIIHANLNWHYCTTEKLLSPLETLALHTIQGAQLTTELANLLRYCCTVSSLMQTVSGCLRLPCSTFMIQLKLQNGILFADVDPHCLFNIWPMNYVSTGPDTDIGSDRSVPSLHLNPVCTTGSWNLSSLSVSSFLVSFSVIKTPTRLNSAAMTF